MAYTYSKITSTDTQGLGNVGQPDTPNLTTGEMQQLLDALPNKIIEKFNEFIDALNEHAGNAIQSDAITNLKFTENGFEFSTDNGVTWGNAGNTIEINAEAKDIALTTYTIGSTYSAISPTDKLTVAVGKLEAGVADNSERLERAMEIVSFDATTGELVTRTMQ